MIYLSASSIKDYLVCSKRFYWRINSPEDSYEPTEEQAEGIKVHAVLEKYLLNEKKAIAEVGKDPRLINCVENAFLYRDIYNLNSSDICEYKFKLKGPEGIYIVGRVDRLNKDNGTVIDWKTGVKSRKYISNDPQYIIYDWAFEKAFGRRAINIAELNINNRTATQYIRNTKYFSWFFDELVVKIARDVKNNLYSREGLFTNSCFRCKYKDVCLKGEQ